MSPDARPMMSVTILQPGDADMLVLRSGAMPRIGASQLLVAVKAAGVNRPDVAQRLGRYPVPADADPTPGLEVAGVVVEVGSGVSRFSVGDRVCALAHGGGYATYCKVEEGQTLPLPAGLTFVEAASLPEVAFTVEVNMMMRAGLQSGESVLIHGGSSGIGAHAIQRAKAAGAKVIVTAGSEEKCRFCLERGADAAINYKAQDWSAETLALTGGVGVDVIIDMVGGDYAARNQSCLAEDGRWCIISLQGGRSAELNLEPLMRRRLTMTGSTLRPLSPQRKALIAREVERKVVPLIEQGRIRPFVFATFPLEHVADAHRLMESGQHLGKIVLEVDSEPA